jgi:hypothetical protein
VWSPELAGLDEGTPVEATIEKITHYSQVPVGPDPPPTIANEQYVTFTAPVPFPENCAYEKVYACPSGLTLEPQSEYQIAGWVRNGYKKTGLFEFDFCTDDQGHPVAY